MLRRSEYRTTMIHKANRMRYLNALHAGLPSRVYNSVLPRTRLYFSTHYKRYLIYLVDDVHVGGGRCFVCVFIGLFKVPGTSGANAPCSIAPRQRGATHPHCSLYTPIHHVHSSRGIKIKGMFVVLTWQCPHDQEAVENKPEPR